MEERWIKDEKKSVFKKPIEDRTDPVEHTICIESKPNIQETSPKWVDLKVV